MLTTTPDRAITSRSTRAGLVLLVMNLVCVTPVVGITAYDCEGEQVQKLTIDLNEPAPCPDPANDYAAPEETHVQLLMTDTALPVEAVRCRITRSVEIHRCGFTSISYGFDVPEFEKMFEVTPEECRQAIKEGKLRLGADLIAVAPNTLTDVVQFPYGRKDSEGYCETTTFTWGAITYDKSYARVRYRIDMGKVRGSLDLTSNVLTFTNGVRVPFKDGVVRDAFEGLIIWESRLPNCEDLISEVAQSKAVLYRRKHSDGQATNEGGILMMRDNATRQYAGLAVKGVVDQCGVRCHSTQVEGLLACLSRGPEEMPRRYGFKPYADIEGANLQTQIGYLILDTRLKTHTRFEQVQRDLCELDRRTLTTKLHLIADTSNPYALLDYYGRGHRAYRAGAVAYVVKCQAVEGVRASFPNCTHEIPLHVNGSLRFANPLTWILQPFPSTVPCSRVMPIRWNIAGRWYCATPDIVECDPPVQLNATMGQYPSQGDFAEGLGYGAFTRDQIDEHRRWVRVQESRDPVSWQTTNTAVGATLDGGLRIPFYEDQVESLASRVHLLLSPIWGILGAVFRHIVEALVILALIKVLVGAVWRMWASFKHHGCGLWVIVSAWNTAYTMITLPQKILDQAMRALREPEVVPDTSIPVAERPYTQLMEELKLMQLRLQALDGLPAGLAGSGHSGPPSAPGASGGPGGEEVGRLLGQRAPTPAPVVQVSFPQSFPMRPV